MQEGHAIVDRQERRDERVTAEIARGAEPFEAIYRRHVGRIYAICRRMTADPQRAEDLTQTTFVRAWRKLGSFRGEAELSAWLRQIAINAVLGDRRATGRRRLREHDDADRRPVREGRAGQRLDLERAIAGLPDGARAVFVLHDVEGYRHGEIAEMLEIATGTSKTQLHRARKLLREALR